MLMYVNKICEFVIFLQFCNHFCKKAGIIWRKKLFPKKMIVVLLVASYCFWNILKAVIKNAKNYDCQKQLYEIAFGCDDLEDKRNWNHLEIINGLCFDFGPLFFFSWNLWIILINFMFWYWFLLFLKDLINSLKKIKL
jgi:hypothetical protein